MDKYCKSFTYNGYSSEDFDLAFGTADGAITDVKMGLKRSSEHSGITKYRLVPNHSGTKYDEVLEFEISLIRDPCKIVNVGDDRFTRSQISEINAWLTSPRFPQLLHFTYNDNDLKDDMDVFYFATFTQVNASAYGDIYALKYTVTCNAPFAFSNEIIRTISSNYSNGGELRIFNTSDEQEINIFPVVVINPTATGKVTIENRTQGKSVTIDCLRDNIVTIDNDKLRISDSTGKLIKLHDLGLDDVGSLYWFSLSYGINDIYITGDAEITISYREPRKVGAY